MVLKVCEIELITGVWEYCTGFKRVQEFRIYNLVQYRYMGLNTVQDYRNMGLPHFSLYAALIYILVIYYNQLKP